MRNAVICFVLLAILVLSGVTIYSMENTTSRKNELDANLSAAMKNSMEILKIDETYVIDDSDNQQLIADFIQNFLVSMNSNGDFQIDILGADAEKGLLSVRVTETYPSLFGKGSVSAERTVVLDDYMNVDEEYFAVTFYEGFEEAVLANPLRQINVYGGSDLGELSADLLKKDGYNIKGWQQVTSGSVGPVITDFSGVHVTSDMDFVAVME